MKLVVDPGHPILLDGALGTELERRGSDTSGVGWTARAIEREPELIETIHTEYITAGARIITANTFRTNPRAHHVEGSSSNKHAFDLTATAVQLALQSRANVQGESRILVAGSIAPVADCFQPELVPENECDLAEEHKLFAGWLEQAGVDLLLIETMSSVREAEIALKAARRATSLPIIVSFVAKNATELLDGSTMEEAIRSVLDADLVMLNCTPISVMLDVAGRFAELATESELRFGFSPNASERLDNGAWELLAHNDQDFVHAAEIFSALGASVIGTCCGSTPHTTNAIRERLGL